MRLFRAFLLILLIASLAGCKMFRNPFSTGGDDGDKTPSTAPSRVIEPAAKYLLAIGGVAAGRDELVIYDDDRNIRDFSGRELVCTADEEIVLLRSRPGYDSEAAGSGVQMVATDPGVTAIRCTVDGAALDQVYEVTIPPQSLIQILVAEAGTQLKEEAELDDSQKDDVVKLSSESKTGNALGSVIRNRIMLINEDDDPDLFEVDDKLYKSAPPASYYDAVILAENQFSPTASNDPSHKTFDDAEDRNFLSGDWVIAYDQAVLTAGGIFNGDISDTTSGAFAFRSPPPEEWSVILGAWTTFQYLIPDGAGFNDSMFPSLAPIQILIHPDVWKYDGGRPSFVFARQRTVADFAVSNSP